MLKSMTARLLILAGCIAVPQVAIGLLNYRTGVVAVQAAKFDVGALPMQIGEWSGTPVDVDPRLFDEVGALSMISRSYSNRAGLRAIVHLTSARAADLNAIEHSPAGCYPSHGWKVLKDEWENDSDGRRFRLMVVEQSGTKAAVVWWYQLGPDLVSDREELRRVLQTLRRQGKTWPPVVKVMFHVVGEFTEKDTISPVQGLDSEIYKWVLTNS